MSREQAVLLTLLAYNVALVAIGLLARGRIRDGADFFLGGRALGPVVAAISASASYVASQFQAAGKSFEETFGLPPGRAS